MSFTDTEKHWLSGFAAATAASRSDVNVAMPHLRGKWSPTNAILRTLNPSFIRQSFHSSRPAMLCTRVCASTANVLERGKDTRPDAVLVPTSPPSYPSAWLLARRVRCRFTWRNHCTSHRDWKSHF